MTDAMDAEFNTVAEWTADVALQLGPDHYLPAGCRGSGSPAALDWLIDNLSVRASDAVLDSGAGAGGPAAYLAQRTDAQPVLLDPARGACRAARRLFGSPVVRGDAGELPFQAAQFDVVWCLGVLCTTSQQDAILDQVRRVVRAAGRFGLLVYVARHRDLGTQPDGNNFPRERELADRMERSGFRIKATAWLGDLAPSPSEWRRREDDIEAELERRHRRDEAWRTAQEQSARIARLIGNGDVAGLLMTAEPVP
jgi:SAM-dependent methyltransferase